MITLAAKRSLAVLRGGREGMRRTALITGGTDGIGKAIARSRCSPRTSSADTYSRALFCGGRVAVACIKLGGAKTNIRRDFPRWMKVIVPLIMDPLLAQSPEDAASSALQVLAEALPHDPTGVLFTKIRRLKRLWPGEQLLDRQEWERLWSSAERLSSAVRAEGHISERATERSLSGFATT
jgi:hypothetical protein